MTNYNNKNIIKFLIFFTLLVLWFLLMIFTLKNYMKDDYKE